MEKSLLRHFTTVLAACVLVAISSGCSESTGSDEDPIILRWAFGEDEELDDWLTGGSAIWLSWCDALPEPAESEEGCAKLDGTGNAGVPNAWIYRDIMLPSDARTLAWWASGHNRDGGDANHRVRLEVSGGTSHTLMDWEEFTGSEGVLNWEERMVSIAAYAGQSVTLYFEQDDNGPGSHEQIYLDEIRILRD